MKKTISIVIALCIATAASFYGCTYTQNLTPEQQDMRHLHAIPAINIIKKDIGTAD